jgi:hypothetical protein
MKDPTKNECMVRRTLLVVLAFFASASAALLIRGRIARSAQPDISEPHALASPTTGHRQEIFFVLVASSTCHGLRVEGFKEQFRRAKESVAKQATARGAVFATVGVAIDPTVGPGLAILREFGPFDEIDAGSNWENLGATAFLWRELPGPGSVPQVLVVSRQVDDDGGAHLSIRADSLLVREVGGNALITWARAGAPIR